MLNLILIDDHPIVLAGLVDILKSQKNYNIVATGTTADAALRLVRDNDCDVLVADLNLPGNML